MSHVRVFLIRHGETDHNVQGIIQGSLDTELNDVGIAQAERTGQVLDQTGVQIVKAWTSDLKRASKTAEIIVGKQKLPCSIEADQRIRERYLGGLQGGRRPKVYDEVALGCEPYEQLLGRCLAFWDTLFPPSRSTSSPLPPQAFFDPRAPATPSTFPSILVVSHGASLHTLVDSGLWRARGVRPAKGVRVPKRLRHSNCSITQVVMRDTGVDGPKRWSGEFHLLADDRHIWGNDTEAKPVEVTDDLSSKGGFRGWQQLIERMHAMRNV